MSKPVSIGSAASGTLAQCVKGSMWLGVGTLTGRLAAFASKVLLTRLLFPEDIGFAVMILSVLSIFEIFTEVGLKQCVIQNPRGRSDEFLNVIWWIQVGRGVCLYLLAFLVAPFVAQLYFAAQPQVIARYSVPEIASILRVVFGYILCNAFTSPRTYVLEKEFRFGYAVIIEQTAAILGAIATVVLACGLRNVWAIALGSALSGVVKSILSYFFCPFVPSCRWDPQSFSSVAKFARGMVGLPVLAYFAYNLDVLVAGRLIPADMVGYYGMALTLAMAPRQVFYKAVSGVLLSAFSAKQNDREAMRKGILATTGVTATFGLPATFLAMLFANTILGLVYGQNYAAVAVAFGWMCVYGLILLQSSPHVALLMGLGMPEKHRLCQVVRTGVLAVTIWPAIEFFGLSGAALAVVIANLAALVMQVGITCRVLGLGWSTYCVAWIPGLIASVVVVSLCVGLNVVLPGNEVSVICAGVTVHGIVAAGVYRKKLYTVLATLPKRTGLEAVEAQVS